MRISKFCRTAAGFLLLSGVLAVGPASASTRIYVKIGPPAPIVETRVAAPGPGYIWVAGYHTWDGGRYVWVPGRWSRPPRAHVAWHPGHWAHEHRGYYWVEGRWR
jgi:hypothetical protein